MLTPAHFNPVTTPLLSGINLIDASAGTGKTYAIAMLVLRFVVEQDVKIDQLLVVTFTKAATDELKDRIRKRLAEAKLAANGKQAGIDSTILTWLAGLTISPEVIKQRLELALLDIDQAGIFTIHGFCQRVLNEHALESGQLFDSELTGEVNAIKQACADDFWRREIYPRDVWEVALLTAQYATPDALLGSVRGIGLYTPVYPEHTDLDALLKSFRLQCHVAQSQLVTLVNALTARFAEGTFKPTYTDTFEVCWQALNAWLTGQTLQIPSIEAFKLLTAEGVKAALNGNKFRSNKTQQGDARKAEYLATLALDHTAFDALADSFSQITLVFRRALLENLRVAVDKHMQQLNVLSFDELINRLADALEGGEGDGLCAELQLRFKVALIDEFQDTDQKQWFIFSRLFAVPSHSLYLIGDPKQAIYKFRGADIYSYFSAQQQAQHNFTLGLNWRSHPQLVAAVNSLLQREQAFLFAQVQFTPVAPGLSDDDGYLADDGQAVPPMCLWQLAEHDKTGYWSASKGTNSSATEAIKISVVNEILQLLGGSFVIKTVAEDSPVQPSDIAILVRSNKQARDYQNTLREAGIPAVLNSTESVFTTQEAADLYRLLQAVANPGDISLLKQALTISWFDVNGQQLYQIINDENALDAWVFRFQGYAQDWLKKGFMAMMLTLLTREKVRTQLSTTRLAERSLTNLQHLLELIQQAALDEHLGIHKTLDWLRTAIIKAEQEKGCADEQQLRLESDAEAVKIVTMHRSKGLEYGLVFCPYLWQRNDYLGSENRLIQCHEQGRMIADLGSTDFNRRRAQALQEELAEELRVFYVAVTRAKYRCYVVWAEVRTKDRPNNSALAYLLDFADTDFSAQQGRLRALCASQPEAFAYQLLANNNSIAGSYRQSLDVASLAAKQRKRNLYTSWQMSSYTALSALSLKDAPELPEDKVMEPDDFEHSGMGAIKGDAAIEQEPLPKGAQLGNVVHELLEYLSFKRLAEPLDISQRRDAACQRYGINLPDPSRIDQLLQHIVQTPLASNDTQFCLKNLADAQCIKEMPFYLALQPLDVSRINQILAQCPAYQPLTAKQMCGYLTGFVDLICLYQGRYYVMDYKTNSLADYQPHTLIAAMREHNYGLQYWLYSVVLHQYLQQRLPDYDYAQHFGGVKYLFVRGMQADVAMSGVYADVPDLPRLDKLVGLFGGG
ncbi:MAG: exodeoxyribonuclease V subunit beta [Methylococcaceae bacterium]|nr:exodeoxyribonuclease V subunit beta [Methylococcaceae bacterium]